MELHISKNPRAVAEDFATFLVDLNQNSDKLNIALSGGSTPQLLFDILAADYKKAIDWSKMHFYWGDERCVPPTDKDSNYGMAKTHLFDKVGIPEANIHRILGENEPKQEAQRHSHEIKKNVTSSDGLPRFDLVILGLGTDGHTASIFSDQMELLKATETCVVATHPESGQKRISLSGPVINNAKSIAFLVTGKSKQARVKEILKHRGKFRTYPASHIKPANGVLYWFLDEAASA
ncbi:MAG: 6-phosphogluconolactonase [Imperialibacter sp.]|uniref:6-phosphogluconolactonase n=1 Tax=Imperialibacter sp. TaxID=2038411 RepID=UPI0032EE2F7E